MSSKTVLIAALALAGSLAAGAASAHERDEVQWSVTIGTPAPMVTVPVVAGAPVYREPYAAYEVHRGEWAPEYRHPTRWDRDGDGIPNRYDHLYNPRWDRDGDGIPNRYDRFDNRRGERERRGWHEEDRHHEGWGR